jgi:putative oxidoreductase
MAAFMRPFESQVYALFRIVTGLLFLWHGTQKLFGFPVPIPPEMTPPWWIVYVGGSIELIGGVLVMIGLLTTWAAFICSGQMAVAYWLGHGLGLMGAFSIFPLVNHGELAILYCFAFLFISARGPGIWSVDGSRSS